MKALLTASVSFALFACASPAEPDPLPPEPDPRALHRPVPPPPEDPAPLERLTVERFFWSHDPANPAWFRERIAPGKLYGLVREWPGFAPIKQFTLDADKRFELTSADSSPGAAPIIAYAATGGMSSSDGALRLVTLSVPKDTNTSRAWIVTSRNDHPDLQWVIVDAHVPAVE